MSSTIVFIRRIHRPLSFVGERLNVASASALVPVRSKFSGVRCQPPTTRVPRRSMVVVTQTKVSEIPQQAQVASSESKPSAQNLSQTQAAEGHDLFITDSCWNRIQQLAAKRNESLDTFHLRVFVDAGGCSGFTYQFELESGTELEKEDIVFQHDASGARVVVDEASYNLIKGSTIDFVQEMIKSSFEVRENPQSESACGCGSSFALKNFAANPAVD